MGDERGGSDEKLSRILRRKIFHLCLGVLFLFLLAVDYPFEYPLLFLLLLGSIVSLLQSRISLPVVSPILERFDRDTDVIPGEGIITFFTGALLVWFLFPDRMATLAVLALSIGDPAASIFGRAFGRLRLPWNREKTLIGTMSFFLVVTSTAFVFTGTIPALITGISGALAESLPFWRRFPLDDNIAVTFLVGGILWLTETLGISSL